MRCKLIKEYAELMLRDINIRHPQKNNIQAQALEKIIDIILNQSVYEIKNNIEAYKAYLKDMRD